MEPPVAVAQVGLQEFMSVPVEGSWLRGFE